MINKIFLYNVNTFGILFLFNSRHVNVVIKCTETYGILPLNGTRALSFDS